MPAKRNALPALADGGAFGQAVVAALAEDPAAAVLKVDLDGLHQLNQTYGLEAGDRVIGAAATVLAKAAQADGWTPARTGGDEFALLLRGLTLEQGFLLAERLRQELNEAIARELPDGAVCTASLGVAASPRDAKRPEELIHKATLALYTAKEQGGNVVALTPGEDMVLKTSYYPAPQLARLRGLAERLKRKDAALLREALDDLLRKYDRA